MLGAQHKGKGDFTAREICSLLGRGSTLVTKIHEVMWETLPLFLCLMLGEEDYRLPLTVHPFKFASWMGRRSGW